MGSRNYLNPRTSKGGGGVGSRNYLTLERPVGDVGSRNYLKPRTSKGMGGDWVQETTLTLEHPRGVGGGFKKLP